jgi:hypothetical protein
MVEDGVSESLFVQEPEFDFLHLVNEPLVSKAIQKETKPGSVELIVFSNIMVKFNHREKVGGAFVVP